MDNAILEGLMSLEFGTYVALAFVLFAIRQATKFDNKYIPVVAIVLGIAFAVLENGSFNDEILLEGIKNALLAVGTVAGVKYLQERKGEDK